MQIRQGKEEVGDKHIEHQEITIQTIADIFEHGENRAGALIITYFGKGFLSSTLRKPNGCEQFKPSCNIPVFGYSLPHPRVD